MRCLTCLSLSNKKLAVPDTELRGIMKFKETMTGEEKTVKCYVNRHFKIRKWIEVKRYELDLLIVRLQISWTIFVNISLLH